MPFEGNSILGLVNRLRGAFYHRNDGLGALDYVPHHQANVYAAYTVRRTDGTVLVRASTANITVSLPDAATMPGHRIAVKKIDPTAYTVTIDAAGGDHVEGVAGLTLSSQNANVIIESDGVGWWILASRGTVAGVTYTDSGALWALVWFGAGNGFAGRQRSQLRALSRGQLYLQGQTFAGR